MGRLRWKELLDDHAALLVLLTAGAVLYGIVASVQWYNMDEGVYLNAAATITRGGVPFVTFAAREPVLLYYLAAGVAIFGPQLLVARLQMVLVDLGTAVAVYLMGRELGGKTAGIAAAGFFLFNPFDVYAFSTVLLEPLAALPLAWIAYLVLRNRRPDPVKVPLIAGLLLGIAELTRRDAILLAPVVLAALFVRLSPTLRPLFHRSSLKAAGYFLVGLALPVGVVLGIFVSLTSVPWMWGQYGLGAAYVEQVVPFPYHVGVLYYLWVYEPLLVIPAVAVPAGSLAARGHRDLAFLSLLLSAGLLGLVLYAGPPNFDWGQGEYELAATGGLLVAQLALWGVSAFDIGFSDHPGPKVPHLALLFLGLWAVIYLFFYVAVYPEFLTNYFTDVSVPLSVLAGLWWSDRIVRPLLSVQELPAVSSPRARRDQWLPMITGLVLATAVVGSGLFTAVEVLGPSNPYNEPLSYNLPQYNLIQRTYSPDLVHQVAHYLDATNTTPRTVMFSADDIFLAAAGRPNLMNLSVVLDQMAYVAYPNDQSAYPYNPYHLAPSMDYLLQVWNRTYVPYVVVGSRTSEMEVMHPILAWYLEENYHVAATFGNSMSLNYVTVWALGAPPAAPATEVHVVPTPGAPTASMA
ncbi:MAG: glycosyltransferase family 39 protein, partial [Nitrososphaerota archaeon]|nr:glycosyltransferase family 39 protein [Nitrososphaerota archaeon]